MKALVLTTAIALGFAAPSFANDQLASNLGLEPGAYSTAQLVAIDRALQDDNETLANHIINGGGNVFGVAPGAANVFASIAAEDDTNGVVRFNDRGTEIISTQSFGGDAATDAGRAFAIEQAREAENWPLVRLLESGGSLGGVQSLY